MKSLVYRLQLDKWSLLLAPRLADNRDLRHNIPEHRTQKQQHDIHAILSKEREIGLWFAIVRCFGRCVCYLEQPKHPMDMTSKRHRKLQLHHKFLNIYIFFLKKKNGKNPNQQNHQVDVKIFFFFLVHLKLCDKLFHLI